MIYWTHENTAEQTVAVAIGRATTTPKSRKKSRYYNLIVS